MARIEQVTRVCDLDRSENGVTTHRLGLDGSEVEIDLCPGHAADLGAALARFISAGRPVRARSRQRKPSRTVQARSHAAAVRAWGRQQGRCRDRGRIPADVIADYDAAHPGGRS